jgi:malonate-semialdehyde dehydrogenase (acetylating)/methylmalonate-semialdehyde dehydrogenase
MAISVAVAVGDATADRLVDALAERVRSLRVDHSQNGSADMGPLITAAHRAKVVDYIGAGVAEGAKLVVDGRGFKLAGHENGFFLGGSLFDRVTPAMKVYREEIFGPVLVVLRAATLDEAIDLVNRNPYGNGTAIFTRSGHAAQRYARDVQVGMIGVNVPIPVPMAFFSFGGWKQSLFGDLHVHGPEGILFYTRRKVVTTRWPASEEESRAGFAMPTLG